MQKKKKKNRLNRLWYIIYWSSSSIRRTALVGTHTTTVRVCLIFREKKKYIHSGHLPEMVVNYSFSPGVEKLRHLNRERPECLHIILIY